MNTLERFRIHEDEYGKFEKVENKRSKRADLHAFILLAELDPDSSSNMIVEAGHDVIYLDPDEGVLDRLSDDQILELVRCGVMCNCDGLNMFA